MKKTMKMKGFILIELIVSIFFLSIITLGIFQSFLTLQNINNKQKIKNEMFNIAKDVVETEISGINYINTETKFIIDISKNSYKENLTKVSVSVYSQELNDETKLSIYYEN